MTSARVNCAAVLLVVIFGLMVTKSRAMAQDGQQEKPTTIDIPLTSIYASWPHKGMKELSRGARTGKDGERVYTEAYGADIASIFRESGQGASNIFLVRGANLTAAIKATRDVFLSGYSVDSPPSGTHQRLADEMWIVVYFGISDTPVPWDVRSVTKSGRSYRVEYAFKQIDVGGPAIQHGFLWIPLGKVQPGPCTLALVEATTNTTVLVRRVLIPKARAQEE